jgi:hypothetical protein
VAGEESISNLDAEKEKHVRLAGRLRIDDGRSSGMTLF